MAGKKHHYLPRKKSTYREANLGAGNEGLYSREAIEDILSGTKGLKPGRGWVIIHVVWE